MWLKLVEDTDHWEVALTKVSINGIAINLTISKDAVLDSGTSLTYLPLSEYQQINETITRGKAC